MGDLIPEATAAEVTEWNYGPVQDVGYACMQRLEGHPIGQALVLQSFSFEPLLEYRPKQFDPKAPLISVQNQPEWMVRKPKLATLESKFDTSEYYKAWSDSNQVYLNQLFFQIKETTNTFGRSQNYLEKLKTHRNPQVRNAITVSENAYSALKSEYGNQQWKSPELSKLSVFNSMDPYRKIISEESRESEVGFANVQIRKINEICTNRHGRYKALANVLKDPGMVNETVNPGITSLLYPNGVESKISWRGQADLISLVQLKLQEELLLGELESSVEYEILSQSKLGDTLVVESPIQQEVGSFDPEACVKEGKLLHEIEGIELIEPSVAKVISTYHETMDRLAPPTNFSTLLSTFGSKSPDPKHQIVKFLKENPRSISGMMLSHPDARQAKLVCHVIEDMTYAEEARNRRRPVIAVGTILFALAVPEAGVPLSAYIFKKSLTDLFHTNAMQKRITQSILTKQIPNLQGREVQAKLQREKTFSTVNLLLSGAGLLASRISYLYNSNPVLEAESIEANFAKIRSAKPNQAFGKDGIKVENDLNKLPAPGNVPNATAQNKGIPIKQYDRTEILWQKGQPKPSNLGDAAEGGVTTGANGKLNTPNNGGVGTKQVVQVQKAVKPFESSTSIANQNSKSVFPDILKFVNSFNLFNRSSEVKQEIEAPKVISNLKKENLNEQYSIGDILQNSENNIPFYLRPPNTNNWDNFSYNESVLKNPMERAQQVIRLGTIDFRVIDQICQILNEKNGSYRAQQIQIDRYVEQNPYVEFLCRMRSSSPIPTNSKDKKPLSPTMTASVETFIKELNTIAPKNGMIQDVEGLLEAKKECEDGKAKDPEYKEFCKKISKEFHDHPELASALRSENVRVWAELLDDVLQGDRTKQKFVKILQAKNICDNGGFLIEEYKEICARIYKNFFQNQTLLPMEREAQVELWNTQTENPVKAEVVKDFNTIRLIHKDGKIPPDAVGRILLLHGMGTFASNSTAMSYMLAVIGTQNISNSKANGVNRYIRTLPTYAPYGAEAIDLPGHGVGDVIENYTEAKQVAEMIARYIKQQMVDETPDLPVYVISRSASPTFVSLIIHEIEKYPGLMKKVMFLSPALPGRPDLKEESLIGVGKALAEAGIPMNMRSLNWYFSLNSSVKWTPEFFGNFPLYIITGGEDSEMLPIEKEIYTGMANANPNIKYKDIPGAKHNVFNTFQAYDSKADGFVDYLEIGKSGYKEMYDFFYDKERVDAYQEKVESSMNTTRGPKNISLETGLSAVWKSLQSGVYDPYLQSYYTYVQLNFPKFKKIVDKVLSGHPEAQQANHPYGNGILAELMSGNIFPGTSNGHPKKPEYTFKRSNLIEEHHASNNNDLWAEAIEILNSINPADLTDKNEKEAYGILYEAYLANHGSIGLSMDQLRTNHRTDTQVRKLIGANEMFITKMQKHESLIGFLCRCLIMLQLKPPFMINPATNTLFDTVLSEKDKQKIVYSGMFYDDPLSAKIISWHFDEISKNTDLNLETGFVEVRKSFQTGKYNPALQSFYDYVKFYLPKYKNDIDKVLSDTHIKDHFNKKIHYTFKNTEEVNHLYSANKNDLWAEAIEILKSIDPTKFPLDDGKQYDEKSKDQRSKEEKLAYDVLYAAYTEHQGKVGKTASQKDLFGPDLFTGLQVNQAILNKVKNRENAIGFLTRLLLLNQFKPPFMYDLATGKPYPDEHTWSKTMVARNFLYDDPIGAKMISWYFDELSKVKMNVTETIPFVIQKDVKVEPKPTVDTKIVPPKVEKPGVQYSGSAKDFDQKWFGYTKQVVDSYRAELNSKAKSDFDELKALLDRYANNVKPGEIEIIKTYLHSNSMLGSLARTCHSILYDLPFYPGHIERDLNDRDKERVNLIASFQDPIGALARSYLNNSTNFFGVRHDLFTPQFTNVPSVTTSNVQPISTSLQNLREPSESSNTSSNFLTIEKIVNGLFQGIDREQIIFIYNAYIDVYGKEFLLDFNLLRHNNQQPKIKSSDLINPTYFASNKVKAINPPLPGFVGPKSLLDIADYIYAVLSMRNSVPSTENRAAEDFKAYDDLRKLDQIIQHWLQTEVLVEPFILEEPNFHEPVVDTRKIWMDFENEAKFNLGEGHFHALLRDLYKTHLVPGAVDLESHIKNGDTASFEKQRALIELKIKIEELLSFMGHGSKNGLAKKWVQALAHAGILGAKGKSNHQENYIEELNQDTDTDVSSPVSIPLELKKLIAPLANSLGFPMWSVENDKGLIHSQYFSVGNQVYYVQDSHSPYSTNNLSLMTEIINQVSQQSTIPLSNLPYGEILKISGGMALVELASGDTNQIGFASEKGANVRWVSLNRLWMKNKTNIGFNSFLVMTSGQSDFQYYYPRQPNLLLNKTIGFYSDGRVIKLDGRTVSESGYVLATILEFDRYGRVIAKISLPDGRKYIRTLTWNEMHRTETMKIPQDQNPANQYFNHLEGTKRIRAWYLAQKQLDNFPNSNKQLAIEILFQMHYIGASEETPPGSGINKPNQEKWLAFTAGIKKLTELGYPQSVIDSVIRLLGDPEVMILGAASASNADSDHTEKENADSKKKKRYEEIGPKRTLPTDSRNFLKNEFAALFNKGKIIHKKFRIETDKQNKINTALDFDDIEGLTYSYIDSSTKQEVVTTLNPNQIGYCVLYLEKKEKTDSDIQEDSKLNKPIFRSGILTRPFNIFDSTTWTPLSSLKQTLLETYKGSAIPRELLGSQNIFFRSLMEGRLQNFSFYDPAASGYKRRPGHYIIAYPSLNGFTYGRIVAIHENNLLEVVNTVGNIELLKQAKVEMAESLTNTQSDLVIEKNPGLRNIVSNDPKDLKIQTNDEFIRDVNEVNQNYIHQEVQKVMDKLRQSTKSTETYIHQMKQIQNIQSMNIEIEFYDPTIFEFSYRSNFDSDASYEKLLENYKTKGIIKLVSDNKILIQYTKTANRTLLHTIAEIDVRNPAKFQIFDNPTLDQLNQ